MAKSSLFDPPVKKSAHQVGKPRFAMPQGANAGDKMKSTGVFSGPAPRVGTGKKRNGVAKKPSRVQSGWVPAKLSSKAKKRKR